MKQFQRQVMLKVVGIHVITITLLIIVPMIPGCFQPKKPEAIFTSVIVESPSSAVSMQAVESLPPAEKSTPEPPSKPEKVEKPVSEPPNTKVKMSQPDIPKPPEKVEPKKKDPVKKWKPISAKDIKIGPKAKPDKPVIDTNKLRNQIRKNLGASQSKPSTQAGSSSVFNAYDAQLIQLFYNAWNPPASSSNQIRAKVQVWFSKGGYITKRSLYASSGDPVLDRTAMDAVNSISTLPKPPKDYPESSIILNFQKPN